MARHDHKNLCCALLASIPLALAALPAAPVTATVQHAAVSHHLALTRPAAFTSHERHLLTAAHPPSHPSPIAATTADVERLPKPHPHHRKAVLTARQAPAAQQAPATVPAQAAGSPQQIAAAMLGSFGWAPDQFGCLDSLWTRESGWNVYATNPNTGAYGIPQALPGSKMATAGADWQTDAATQIKWGLQYLDAQYGSPCAGWGHEQATGWY